MKYVVDLKVVPVVIEVRIHPNEDGKSVVPPELRSDVTYGLGIVRRQYKMTQ